MLDCKGKAPKNDVLIYWHGFSPTNVYLLETLGSFQRLTTLTPSQVMLILLRMCAVTLLIRFEIQLAFLAKERRCCCLMGHSKYWKQYMGSRLALQTISLSQLTQEFFGP
jgi:hypothetical protein